MDNQQQKEVGKLVTAKAMVGKYYPLGVRDQFQNVQGGDVKDLNAIVGQVGARLGLGAADLKALRFHLQGKNFWDSRGVNDWSNPQNLHGSVGNYSGHNIASTALCRIQKGTQWADVADDCDVMLGAYDAFNGLMAGLFPDTDTGRKERDWLWMWLYKRVTMPTRKSGQIVLLHDVGGSGKSTIGQCVRNLIGAKNTAIVETAGKLANDFITGELQGSVFVQIDECKSKAGSVLDSLKSWSTVDTLLVNSKGVQQYQADNYCNFFMGSNAPDGAPLPFEVENRRFFWFRTLKADAAKTNGAYLGQLWDSGKSKQKAAILGVWEAISDAHQRIKGDASNEWFKVSGGHTSGFNWMRKRDAGSDLDDVISLLKGCRVGELDDGSEVLNVGALLKAAKAAGNKAATLDSLQTQLEKLGYWVGVNLSYQGKDAVVYQNLKDMFGAPRRFHVAVAGGADPRLAGGGTWAWALGAKAF